MSADFKAKMHEIISSAGGAYSAPPTKPIAGFKGPTSKRRGGRGKQGVEGGEGSALLFCP